MGCTPSKILLCAGLITLTQMSLGIEAGHAALDPTLPESLLNQSIPPPEDLDGPLRYWNRRKKYFLVIAVNQTDVPKTELPFALVDGQLVVNALIGLGYQPLDQAYPILTGKDATASAIMASLDEARRKGEEATIVVYYTGHGAVGAMDLWLQTAGQVKVGDGQGIKVSDLVVQIRQTAAGKAFEGELVLILDACYSGQGIVSQGLNLRNLGKRTTILTSSADIQESFSLNPPDVPKQMSAFTHTFLQGLGPDWAKADDNGDGMLSWGELQLYATNQLLNFKERGALAQPMEPSMLTNYSQGFLTYRRDQVRVWRSNHRTYFMTNETSENLAAPLQRLGVNPKDTPALPKEAQRLAQQLDPAPEDYYAQAVKATAEGQLEKARALFAKAETQSQERATQGDAAKQEETKKQGQIYLARARMEMYAGQFTKAFSQYQQASKISPPTTPELLNEMGLACLQAGKYPEAEMYLTQAFKQRKQDLAPSHPDLAVSLNNLAALYDSQGKYAEAEPLYQRALQIDEAALGATHPGVAIDLNNLAVLLKTQGKYAEAEPLYQRALSITEAALGPTHPSVAIRLNNLALLFQTQAKYAEAEPLYQRALQIDEAALGATHPGVAIDLNNLAILLETQGKYAEAEPLYQRALSIAEAALGPTHPSVAMTLNNLAALYDSQDKYTEAEPLYQRALSITEAALGPTHPSVAIRLNNLAVLYNNQGKYAEAEPLYQRALQIDEAALGAIHPGVAIDLNNLAVLLKTQGKYAEAEPLYQRALSITEAALGPTHPSVAIRLNNLALLFQTQAKYAEAEPLFQRGFWILHHRLRPEHPSVRKAFADYQDFLKASGQPHTESDVWEKLRSSIYSQTNTLPSP